MLTTTEAQIEEAFSVHAPVERVKKIKDYAFVHFGTKQNAHMAMQAMNGKLFRMLILSILWGNKLSLWHELGGRNNLICGWFYPILCVVSQLGRPVALGALS